MTEIINFVTNETLLKPSSELTQEVLSLLKGDKAESIVKLPQLVDLPFSIKLKKTIIGPILSVPTQSISAVIVSDIDGMPVPFAGVTATFEPSDTSINISAIYSNLTREAEFGGKYKFSGVTALLSTIDEAIAEAANQFYPLDVIRKGQTTSDTVKKLFIDRGFTKTGAHPEGNTFWEKRYTKPKMD